MDFIGSYQHAMADGYIDQQEADRLIALAVGMVPDVSTLVISMDHLSTVIAGSNGVFSPRAERGWIEAHRSRGNIVAIPRTMARDEETA
jgi:hypothetical protein